MIDEIMLNLKPTHKVIKDYYAAIQNLRDTGHVKEESVAPYFANLLRHCTGLNQELDLVEEKIKLFLVKKNQRFSLSPFCKISFIL